VFLNLPNLRRRVEAISKEGRKGGVETISKEGGVEAISKELWSGDHQ
jgi:hypothetical protein